MTAAGIGPAARALALMSNSDLVLVKKKSSRTNSSKCRAVCSTISLYGLAMLGFEYEKVSKRFCSLRVGDAAGHGDPAFGEELLRGVQASHRRRASIAVRFQVDLVDVNLADTRPSYPPATRVCHLLTSCARQ